METEPVTFTFFLKIFPHTRYGVSDVASVLLFMVQLEKLYSMAAAMLYHWNMIQPHDKQDERKSMLMPFLFTSYDNYL
jgi:hypothetical protein